MTRFKMIFLDVTSLFANVPSRKRSTTCFNIITVKEMKLGIPMAEIKEFLLRCTLNVQFSFNNKLYQQTDGV